MDITLKYIKELHEMNNEAVLKFREQSHELRKSTLGKDPSDGRLEAEQLAQLLDNTAAHLDNACRELKHLAGSIALDDVG